jgi:arylsulfatase A-like enzyme
VPLVALRRRGAAAAAVVLCLAAACQEGEPKKSPESGPPNVLIIYTDDQRKGLDVMDATRDFFADGGKTFENAVTVIPVCCPARASLFTGQYMHNHGVRTNLSVRELDQSATLQRYLHDAGYRTGMYGKFMNGWNDAPPYFDDFAIRIKPDRYVGGTWNIDGQTKVVNRYSTSFVSDEATEFLESTEAEDDKPWYLYVAPDAPHLPSTPEPRYEGAAIPEYKPGPAVGEKDVSDKPFFLRRLEPITEAEGRSLRNKQLRTLLSVDDLVEQLTATLSELSEDRDTLAFFMSDNGFLFGEHGVKRKGWPYREAIRVPLMMRWPEHVDPGAMDSRLVGNLDLAPTVLDAAGLEDSPKIEMDGHSLLDDAWSREEILAEYGVDPEETHVPNWAAIYSEDFHFIESYGKDDDTVIFQEYYDLTSDPYELENLLRDGNDANDPQVGALSKRLAGYRVCSGSDCP